MIVRQVSQNGFVDAGSRNAASSVRDQGSVTNSQDPYGASEPGIPLPPYPLGLDRNSLGRGCARNVARAPMTAYATSRTVASGRDRL